MNLIHLENPFKDKQVLLGVDVYCLKHIFNILLHGYQMVLWGYCLRMSGLHISVMWDLLLQPFFSLLLLPNILKCWEIVLSLLLLTRDGCEIKSCFCQELVPTRPIHQHHLPLCLTIHLSMSSFRVPRKRKWCDALARGNRQQWSRGSIYKGKLEMDEMLFNSL